MKFLAFFFTLVLLINLFANLPAAQADSGSHVNDFRVCSAFLKKPLKIQRAEFIPGRLSFAGLVQSCRALVRRGLKSAIYADRKDERNWNDSDDDSTPNYSDACMGGSSSSINCTNHGPGSIWDATGCNQSPGSINCGQ